MDKPLEDWTQEESFGVAKNIVNNIKVVNAIAEIELKLMKDYNKSMTKDEEQNQYMLQVV